MRYLPWLRGAASALTLVACLSGCHESTSGGEATLGARIILFDGAGSSPNDVQAIKSLLAREKLEYITADSDELDLLTAEQLAHAELLIMPGGNYEQMGKGLRADTTQRIRDAVNHGMNYLGICAGAFIAGAAPDNGFNITGTHFAFFADSKLGTRKEVVTLENGDGTHFKTYWEDGPELTGWGDALARYADGTPAVVQGKVGTGWMVLTGVHLEAPANWYDGLEPATPAVSIDKAAKLIRAAFDGEALPYL
jgi:glutamine amidotransferase-like uncharacterized protein